MAVLRLLRHDPCLNRVLHTYLEHANQRGTVGKLTIGDVVITHAQINGDRYTPL